MAALQKGQTVLITGATGQIGSHVVEEALKAGLKVKAAARNEDKAKQLKSYFGEKHGANFETCIVSDMLQPGAYNEAIKGVHGVVHLASVLTFSSKWDEVVTPSVEGALSMLKAAAGQSAVTRVVLTSSSTACGMPNTKEAQHFDVNSWNDASIIDAKKEPNPWNIYASSKTEAERAAWKFVKDNEPSFALTTVCPNANFGPSCPAASSSSTHDWPIQVRAGNAKLIGSFDPQWFINTVDDARLHIAGLMRDDVKNERILAFTSSYTWQDMVDAVKKADPSAKPVEGVSKEHLAAKDLTTVDNARMLEILGKDTVVDFDTSVAQVFGK